MEIVSRASSMHDLSRALHAKGRSLAFVPTMGALHEGHLSLVCEAHNHADDVVVSIFVNPAQFGPNEDFAKYPRDLEKDSKLLSSCGVQYVFAPAVEEIFPAGYRTFVEVEDWGKRLCGASRPGHFRGVTTVVAKLFNIVEPDVALFGRKDAQQAIIIQRMVRDLNFPVKIITCPIVREPDGLAMSSRNRYLRPEERRAALALFRSLRHARMLYEHGQRDTRLLYEEMKKVFKSEPLVHLDYIELVDPHNLEPVEKVSAGTLIAVAAFIGKTRLIDNWSVGAEEPAFQTIAEATPTTP